MSIIIDETRDRCESCGIACCSSCAERLLHVCNDCGSVACEYCRLWYGNEWYCCALSASDDAEAKPPCHVCDAEHWPYCPPADLALGKECQAYNAQFTGPIAAITDPQGRARLPF